MDKTNKLKKNLQLFEKKFGQKFSTVLDRIADGEEIDDLFFTLSGLFSNDQNIISIQSVYPSPKDYGKVITNFLLYLKNEYGGFKGEELVPLIYNEIVLSTMPKKGFENLLKSIDETFTKIQEEGVSKDKEQTLKFIMSLDALQQEISMLHDHIMDIQTSIMGMVELDIDEILKKDV